MFDAYSLTEYLGLMFGVYLLAAGIGLLIDGSDYSEMLEEFSENPALGYISGVVVFALGVVLVRLHNDWSSLFTGVVSFIGWACLVEGILILAFRRLFLGFFSRLTFSPGVVRGFSLICFVVGGWLIGQVVL